MKKAIFILLVLVMVLSLAACNDGSASVPTADTTSTEVESFQFDVANAVVETPKHIYKDAEENQARAKQTTYIFACEVDTINDTFFTCRNLEICLPTEELANLNVGDSIAIIGRITEFKEETNIAGTFPYGKVEFSLPSLEIGLG